jgi:hypothetical protein
LRKLARETYNEYERVRGECPAFLSLLAGEMFKFLGRQKEYMESGEEHTPYEPLRKDVVKTWLYGNLLRQCGAFSNTPEEYASLVFFFFQYHLLELLFGTFSQHLRDQERDAPECVFGAPAEAFISIQD